MKAHLNRTTGRKSTMGFEIPIPACTNDPFKRFVGYDIDKFNALPEAEQCSKCKASYHYKKLNK